MYARLALLERWWWDESWLQIFTLWQVSLITCPWTPVWQNTNGENRSWELDKTSYRYLSLSILVGGLRGCCLNLRIYCDILSEVVFQNEMRAVLIKDGKGPVENLYIGDAPKPTLGKGEVLVKERLPSFARWLLIFPPRYEHLAWIEWILPNGRANILYPLEYPPF